MRTIFDDVTEREDREDPDKGSRRHWLLWLVALIFVGGAYGAWRWASTRKPPEAPPPPVSIRDDHQVNMVIQNFNNLVKEDKWDEAEKMLSREAVMELGAQNKSLHDSILGDKYKDKKVVEALTTPSRGETKTTSRVDCAFLFEDRQTLIVFLTVVNEDGRLAINSW